MSYKIILDLYTKYVKSTENGAIVQDIQVLLCNLTHAVAKGINSKCIRVHIGSRVLKHVYDKRPAEEFDFLVGNVHQIAKYPDHIYRNKDKKKGDFIFVKKIKNKTYVCSLQEIMREEDSRRCEVVTFFRIRKDNYLASYELL